MTRKEVIGNATLYLGDALEILPTLEKVDAVITDPPYVGLVGGLDRSVFGGVAARSVGDSISVGDVWRADLQWCSLAWRVASFGVMVFSGHKSVSETREAFPDAKVVALLTWYKRNAPPTGKNLPRWTTEFAWALSKSPGIHWDALKTTLFDVPGLAAGCMAVERELDPEGRSAHPTQKPVALMKELVTLVDGAVLDPFMGSGTTGVACMSLRRQFIGIEIEPKYFDIACSRIENAQRQVRMFA